MWRRLLLLLLWLTGLLTACAETRAPSLLKVSELGPRELEVGDRISALGTGFPEGKSATVTFRGDLFRPGQAPERDVILEAAARAVSLHEVAIDVTDKLAREFCGADLLHTTFRGEVLIAFAPHHRSGFLVKGSVEGAVLDFYPPLGATPRTDDDSEGRRFAQFLGLTLREAPGKSGLLVDDVKIGSRGARAGFNKNDLLNELEGVHLRSLADFIPLPKTRSAAVVVARGAVANTVTLWVDSTGFRAQTLAQLRPAFGALGLFAVALLFCFSPLAKLWQRVECQISMRTQELLRAAPDSKASVLELLLRELPAETGYYAWIVLFSALFGWVAAGRNLVLREFDMPILLLAGFAAHAAYVLVHGQKTLRQRLRVIWAWWVLRGVGVAAVLLAFFHEQGSAQIGPWPWQWSIFSSLFNALCALVYLAAMVPVLVPAQSKQRVTHADFIEVWWAAGIFAVCFLGGKNALWNVHPAVSALLLVVKLLGAGITLLLLRWVFGYPALSESVGLKRLLVSSGCGLAALQALEINRILPKAALAWFPNWLLFAAFMCGVLFLGSRVLRQRAHAAWDLGVNPWI